MSQTVERTSFDLRFQSYRLRNDAAETRLLASIAERGIEQSLAGVDTPSGRLLLNGFKRYRCAEKLGIESVPYVALAEDEADGIAKLMRRGKDQTLSILEQAKFVVELLTIHDMSLAEVAETLSRSKSWVCMRRGLFEEMIEPLQAILFRGAFPVYSFMYTLRPFMRMNGVTHEDIERFVKSLAGQRLSVREIELLADGYFRGPKSLRKEIDAGNWKWSLQQMQSVPEDPEACNDTERALLSDLGKLLALMQRVTMRCDHKNLQSRAFFAQANLLLVRLLSKRETFFHQMEEFHDRSGQA